MNVSRPKRIGIVLLLSALLISIGGGFFLWRVPRQWQAVVYLHAENEELQRLEIENWRNQRGPFFIQTEFERIQSKKVLYQVISRLHLIERWKNQFHRNQSVSTNDIYQLLRKQVNVSQDQLGRIEIRINTHGASDSVEIANAIAATYVRMRIENLERQTGDAAKKLITVTRWANLPAHQVFPPPALTWTIVGAVMMVGSGGLYLVAKQPSAAQKRLVKSVNFV